MWPLIVGSNPAAANPSCSVNSVASRTTDGRLAHSTSDALRARQFSRGSGHSADGIVLGSDHGRWSYWRKVATVKRSCKPAATPQGFPTSTQPQLDHPDLRCGNIIHSTTKQTHSTHNSVDLGEHHYFLQP
jgi:hypothetical protein